MGSDLTTTHNSGCRNKNEDAQSKRQDDVHLKAEPCMVRL